MRIRKVKPCLHVNYKSVSRVCACVCAPRPRPCVRARMCTFVCVRAYQVTLSRGRSSTKEMHGWLTL
jgi:hypothetical protein